MSVFEWIEGRFKGRISDLISTISVISKYISGAYIWKRDTNSDIMTKCNNKSFSKENET